MDVLVHLDRRRPVVLRFLIATGREPGDVTLAGLEGITDEAAAAFVTRALAHEAFASTKKFEDIQQGSAQVQLDYQQYGLELRFRGFRDRMISPWVGLRLARSTSRPQTPDELGQLVRQEFGGEACLIGFSTHAGTVTAARDWDSPAEQRRVTVNLAPSGVRKSGPGLDLPFALGLMTAPEGHRLPRRIHVPELGLTGLLSGRMRKNSTFPENDHRNYNRDDC